MLKVNKKDTRTIFYRLNVAWIYANWTSKKKHLERISFILSNCFDFMLQAVRYLYFWNRLTVDSRKLGMWRDPWKSSSYLGFEFLRNKLKTKKMMKMIIRMLYFFECYIFEQEDTLNKNNKTLVQTNSRTVWRNFSQDWKTDWLNRQDLFKNFIMFRLISKPLTEIGDMNPGIRKAFK